MDSNSDEFHIEIKDNLVEEGENIEVVVPPKAKKRKVALAYNGDDYTIPESVSKLNKIVSYSYRFVVYAFLFVPRLDLVCILYFVSINNYLQMLTLELNFASF